VSLKKKHLAGPGERDAFALRCLVSPQEAPPSFSPGGLLLPLRSQVRSIPDSGSPAWHTHVSKQLLQRLRLRLRLFPRFSLSRKFGAPSVNVQWSLRSFLGHIGFSAGPIFAFAG
jgi:hypothetical protein